MSQNRKSVARFGEAMVERLDANNHKYHWTHFDADHLCKRLVEELEELRLAMAQREPVDRVRAEAADVANFAMMVAETYKVPR